MKNFSFIACILFVLSCSSDDIAFELVCENGELSYDGDISCLDNAFSLVSETSTEITLNYINKDDLITTVYFFYSNGNTQTTVTRSGLTCGFTPLRDDVNWSISTKSGRFYMKYHCNGGRVNIIEGYYENVEQQLK